jgi:hypothetical protein
MRRALRLLSLSLVLFAVLPGLPVHSQTQAQAIPTPESVLGFQAGADFRLANYEQVVKYFQLMDEASDRVMLVQAGRSTQGRPYYFALVSTPENLKRIDRYREIARRLAHPEGLTDAEARALVARARRSCTSTAASTPRKSPAASTCRSSCTTSSAARLPTRRSPRCSTT